VVPVGEGDLPRALQAAGRAQADSTVESVVTIDLNTWHRALHQVTGSLCLKFTKATAADLKQWDKQQFDSLIRRLPNPMSPVSGNLGSRNQRL
jgi:hypothetical protein